MKNIFLLLLIFTTSGCNASGRAQESLDAGMRLGIDVRTAFFIKAWTLNRALITEARRKWIGDAANAILEKSKDEFISTKEVMQILGKLNQDIGQDEAIVTESFAYLAFLLVAGERADQYLGQVDIYLESQKPIWKFLSKHGRETATDALKELKAWKPLIKNIDQSNINLSE